jgi:hypothetical protein
MGFVAIHPAVIGRLNPVSIHVQAMQAVGNTARFFVFLMPDRA